MLTVGQAIAAIAVMAVVTFLTRFLPFLLFDRGDSPPKLVLYLGRVLPPAIIAMLIIYCLRNPSISATPYLPETLTGWLLPIATFFVSWAPQLIAGVTVVLLHVWKRNNLLSIFGGTILYMILIQFVFV